MEYFDVWTSDSSEHSSKISAEIPSCFPKTLRGLTQQGWFLDEVKVCTERVRVWSVGAYANGGRGKTVDLNRMNARILFFGA
jgi:hypothetical protein